MAQPVEHKTTPARRARAQGNFPCALVTSARISCLGILCLGVVFGCSSESDRPALSNASGAAGVNRPPVIQQATIVPSPIVLNGPVSVQIEAEDPDRNPLTFRHQWFINGTRVEGEARPTLPSTLLKRGDKVHVGIVASDGQSDSPVYQTASVLVGNTPPGVISVKVEPAGADRTQFKATVESADVDADDIQLHYRWRRNKTVVAEGPQATLDTRAFARGDSVTVEVTARDAGGAGSPKLSDPIVLGNSAPLITSIPPVKYEKGLFSYNVQATDEDKDALNFELATAPPGMKIDPTSGIVSWNIGPDAKGSYRVRIVVQDGQGGTASQDFDIAIASSPTAS